MGRFAVVRECLSRSLESLGRFRVEGEMIVIYLGGIGAFQVGRARLIPVLLRLGDEVIREWKGSDDSYSGAVDVVPVRRVKRVLEGNDKKGAVFEVKYLK